VIGLLSEGHASGGALVAFVTANPWTLGDVAAVVTIILVGLVAGWWG
jgi:hypothetical protein